MMKNIYGIDSSAPSGRILFLFYFPGVKTPGFIILPFKGIFDANLLNLCNYICKRGKEGQKFISLPY